MLSSILKPSASYFITEIEKYLSKIKLNDPLWVEYNSIFNVKNDDQFRRKLMFFKNKVTRLHDEANHDGSKYA